MARAALVLCACAYALEGVDAARILVAAPTPSISHQVVFRVLAQALARRGHHTVLLTTDPAFPPGAAPPNLTEIDLHHSYKSWRERFIATASGDQSDLYTQVHTAYSLIVEIFAEQMRNEEVKKMLAEESFDVVVGESWTRPTLVLAHCFGARAVQLSSFGAFNEQYELLGVPGHPFLYPDFVRTRIYNLTLWEKAKELYYRYRIHQIIMSFEEREDAMLREVFGPKTPPLRELQAQVELLLVNVHPLWDGYRPVPPNVVHLGGVHVAPYKDLPQELQSFMDASTHGVIYVSFGTNTDPSRLPAATALMTRVFGALRYDVLWKWPDAPPGLPKNIRTETWLPQPDLLRHKKLVLFITQAGLQSTDEALRAGVPLLALPMLGDQWYNAEQYERFGVGLRLDLATLTDQQLHNAIETLVNDKSYRENSVLLGQEMLDQPQSALERAVWWVERVLRRRGPSMRAPTAAVSWPQFLELELVCAALAVVSLTLAATILVVVCLYKVVFKRVTKVKAA